MKSIKIILAISVLTFVFSCKTTKNLVTDKTPFQIENATYSTWVGGVKGVRGYKVEIQLNNYYKLDSIYFRNMKTNFESKKSDSKSNIAIFTISDNQKDVIVHSSSKKEFGNKVPNLQKGIPFELKDNEAIISFQTKKGTQYFKIENLQKGDSKHFP